MNFFIYKRCTIV